MRYASERGTIEKEKINGLVWINRREIGTIHVKEGSKYNSIV
jgi:hypothetical protein